MPMWEHWLGLYPEYLLITVTYHNRKCIIKINQFETTVHQVHPLLLKPLIFLNYHEVLPLLLVSASRSTVYLNLLLHFTECQLCNRLADLVLALKCYLVFPHPEISRTSCWNFITPKVAFDQERIGRILVNGSDSTVKWLVLLTSHTENLLIYLLSPAMN